MLFLYSVAQLELGSINGIYGLLYIQQYRFASHKHVDMEFNRESKAIPNLVTGLNKENKKRVK